MRLVSTRESIDRGEISLLAIVETLLAVTVLVGMSVWFDPFKWLAGACAIAPLLLLRTKDSVERGLRWRRWLIENKKIRLTIVIIGSLLVVWAVCFSLRSWRAQLCLLLLFGLEHGVSLSLQYFVIRFGATALSVLKHPLQGMLAIPENWRRIVLATDSHTPPEFLPGADADIGQVDLLGEGVYIHGAYRRWFELTSFLALYSLTALYRWSVKATCLIYLPLVWLVSTARFTPGSMRQTLEDYLADDIQRVRRVLAAVVFAALTLKITLLWYVNDAVLWVKENVPVWVLKILRDWDHYVVPHQIPLWQIAPAVNGILAIGLWLYTRRVLYLKERAPTEGTVLAAWRTVTTLTLFLSMYTIGCTVLITWKAGHLAEALSRLWSMIGKQLIP